MSWSKPYGRKEEGLFAAASQVEQLAVARTDLGPGRFPTGKPGDAQHQRAYRWAGCRPGSWQLPVVFFRSPVSRRALSGTGRIGDFRPPADQIPPLPSTGLIFQHRRVS